MFGRRPSASAGRFRSGELVEVRGVREILATLDAEGRLEGLPFMPEMVKCCGRRFRVYRHVERVYLDKHYYVARLTNTVLLKDVRCDGRGHGGCQMGCLLLWKTAWLKWADETGNPAPPEEGGLVPRPGQLPTEKSGRFCCQPVQLVEATRRLPWWDLRQYVRDAVAGERTLGELARMMLRGTRNRIRWRLGLPLVGAVRGSQAKTPDACLGLQPGELVQVKGFAEIRATLDPQGRTRGLGFAPDMMRFCGHTFRVARRVGRVILEWSGEIREVRNTVALEGATCRGLDQRCCPRDCYHLWREVWLRRLPDRG